MLEIYDEPYLNSEELVDALIADLHRYPTGVMRRRAGEPIKDFPEETHEQYRIRLVRYIDNMLDYIKTIDTLPEVLPEMTEPVSTIIHAKKRYIKALRTELGKEYNYALFTQTV